MAVGTGISVSIWYYKWQNIPCYNELSTLCLGSIMYGTYLYLFCDFAMRKFCLSEKKSL
jgi:hypothetical protein